MIRAAKLLQICLPVLMEASQVSNLCRTYEFSLVALEGMFNDCLDVLIECYTSINVGKDSSVVTFPPLSDCSLPPFWRSVHESSIRLPKNTVY